ncbi:aminotransferase class I/II-fold pyridoxal phosphate-dependent enzyme [Sporolactobacillus kofuensis]|uniref:Aminotransferase class I/II-fold pyridoxal phosphate-dependent enzyme n=1 Tax=Sporolactobacillus kofuensis TaxID=269672 RepID=A0ABW1WFV5_9BACL|nr:aminotransferase class I/II-fold pyridoxal phosphate-dependent enzyme [Sporolactobacillus kofuensis]MCO7176907.1 aminotransferase class I/II-fold pyridoxal phosphate-dependent enzyme [Sporolactobacillus kofuensis]
MDQNRTPIFDGLVDYNRQQLYSFHVPGHKDGLIFPEKAAELFKSILSIDATEVAHLDDLYHPEGMLGEAECLLADYYKTIKSYFLVGGSTLGNLTMVMATCAPGDVVFVQRDSHKSIFNALKMAGAHPIFIAPEIDAETGLSIGMDPESLARCLKRWPKAKALILTYPNYYGIAAHSVRRLIEQGQEHGLLILVDEAHGPHFKMGTPIPPSTLDMGADFVVHSAHKMLPAMTMGAYLHVNSSRVSYDKIASIREMLQSSSPSYPIMASLDLARYFMATLTREHLSQMLEQRDRFVEQLQSVHGLQVLQTDPKRFTVDPFKITLTLNTQETGFDVQEKLIASGLYPEMADPRHVLLVLGLTDQIHYDNAYFRIRQVVSACTPRVTEYSEKPPSFPASIELSDTYRNLSGMRVVEVDQYQAIGKICAEHVIPYPPGIPVIIQGECITARNIEMIRYWQRAGAAFQNESSNHEKIKIYQAGVS